LQYFKELGRFRDQRIDEDGADLSGGEEENAGVHGSHPDSHRDHQEGFEDLLATQVEKQDSDRDEREACEGDGRLCRKESAEALKDVERIEVHAAPAQVVSTTVLWG